jgi:hypothetical protein
MKLKNNFPDPSTCLFGNIHHMQLVKAGKKRKPYHHNRFLSVSKNDSRDVTDTSWSD